MTATSYATQATKNVDEEEKKEPEADSTQDTTTTAEEDSESARIENLKANWNK